MYVRKHFERYLTETEEKQLFSYVDQFRDILARRDRAWMGVLRHTGLRVQPMSLLTVADARDALRLGKLMVRPEINKRGRGYPVPVNKEARRCLRALLSIRREMGYRDEGPLVMGRNHKALSVRSYQNRLKHWREAAGLQVDASPHWLRHTLAKRIIARSESRNPLAVVQVALGQSTIVSAGVYTLPDREEVARSMEAVA